MIKVKNISKKFDKKNIFKNFNLLISIEDLVIKSGVSECRIIAD
ncbi:MULTISPECIES: hypothetical protein [unclassified Gemella]|nr:MULTISPECIES: hypothetical protein [unclassified Gemella]